MEYNTSRKDILIPEYGRNIEKLVIYTLNKVKDKKKIKKNIKYIIKLMILISPNFKINLFNYKNNIWYKLLNLSKIKIKNNYPFFFKKIKEKKKKINYPKNFKKFKYYGKLIQLIINNIIINIKDKKKKKKYIYIIANIMKYNYIKWNNNINIDDYIIFKDIKKISNGKINLINNFKPLKKIIKKKKINKNIYNKRFYKKKKFYYKKKKLI
ncbi:MAG: DUF4290 domain-containing protein [Candidatus Shikimatogenerans bostrichidophilus]|nr:MAG: DUF4290 domain-containing protein [Candidatus Shikimatogenerans bostrichidophilus]